MEGSSTRSKNTTKQHPKKPTAEANVEILQLKILLKRSKPPVWRRIQIPSSYTFKELHRATNQAMGWLDCHLHEFTYINKNNGTKLRINQENNEENNYFMQFSMPSDWSNVFETEILVINVLKNEKDSVDYEYDFGDGWLHKITLEKKLLVKQSELKNFPKCLAGRRACPPEDFGGIDSFNTLITLLASKDTSHPDFERHMDQLNFMNSDFEPAAFDSNTIFQDGLEPDVDVDNCCPS